MVMVVPKIRPVLLDQVEQGMRYRVVASHDRVVTLLGIKPRGGSLSLFQGNLGETIKRPIISRTMKQRQIVVVPAQRKILGEIAQNRGVMAKGLN